MLLRLRAARGSTVSPHRSCQTVLLRASGRGLMATDRVPDGRGDDALAQRDFTLLLVGPGLRQKPRVRQLSCPPISHQTD